jgi:hypothetical protein
MVLAPSSTLSAAKIVAAPLVLPATMVFAVLV